MQEQEGAEPGRAPVAATGAVAAAVLPLAGFTVGVTADRRAGELAELLKRRGAGIMRVPVLRVVPAPADAKSLAAAKRFDRLLDAMVKRTVDAVTFTNAAASTGLIARAEQRGIQQQLFDALRHGVIAGCACPVTAGPLEARDVPTLVPERFRIGPLVQLLASELSGRVTPLLIAGQRVEIRGRLVIVDGEPRPVSPAGRALLRTLARRPGWVVSRAELLRALPGAGRDEHAGRLVTRRL